MENLDQLQQDMEFLEMKITHAAVLREKLITSLPMAQQNSATNLIQYLALRNEDVRLLQDDLHQAGLSSLTSSESHILKQVQSIRQRLGATLKEKSLSHFDYHAAQLTLNKNTSTLFGFKKVTSLPYIMVTLDNSFENDVNLVIALLKAGMNVARINCAHGDENNWNQLIRTLHLAMDKSGCACKLYMDIAGPKMRVALPGKGKKSGKLKIALGDEILLVEKGVPVPHDKRAISCDESGVISQIQEGDRMIIDDGKFEGILLIDKGESYLKITRISSKKACLKKEKGLNLPDTFLDLPVLSEADYRAIPFIAANADLAGCSFLRNTSDLKLIKEAFEGQERTPYLILKIETPEAVINLPALLLEAMTEEVFGVMIARGDLAVEIGVERLSEIQDEILWICEAANTPVIWATQVLETFSKLGIATRSEVTDAAHAAKADCVMLNKGDFIIDTLKLLKKILNKSGGHRHKKRYSMRPLNIAAHFLKQTE